MNRRDALRTLAAGSAAGALAAGAVAAVAPLAKASTTDPLLALCIAYREGLAAYNASGDQNAEADAALAAVTWEPPYCALTDNPPAATTLAGVVAAIRTVRDEEKNCGGAEDFAVSVLGAALAYFEGKA